MSYVSKGSEAQALQLKVQSLVVALGDAVLLASGSTPIIDVGQTISTIKGALFIDNSAGTVAPVVAASQSVSGSTVTLTLSATLAANDVIVLNFTV